MGIVYYSYRNMFNYFYSKIISNFAVYFQKDKPREFRCSSISHASRPYTSVPGTRVQRGVAREGTCVVESLVCRSIPIILFSVWFLFSVWVLARPFLCHRDNFLTDFSILVSSVFSALKWPSSFQRVFTSSLDAPCFSFISSMSKFMNKKLWL